MEGDKNLSGKSTGGNFSRWGRGDEQIFGWWGKGVGKPWWGVWRYRISKCIKERACRNSTGELKKKWNFRQWSKKNHVEFPSVLVFRLGDSKVCHTILWISKGEVLFSLEFPRVNWQMGYSRQKPNGGGVVLRKWNFQRYQRNRMSNFHGLIKNEVKFPGFPVWSFSGIAHLGVCICTEISHWNMKSFLC